MNAHRNRKTGIRVAVVMSAAVFLAGAGAGAQGRGGGPQLSPEKLNAAWTLEAQGVSKDIGLSEADANKVVAAYKTSRESHGKAMQELMSTGERGPGMFQQMQEIADTERSTLAKGLETEIGKANADKAVAVLGTYNRQWDRFVDTLAGFGLESDKQFKGLSLIATYVVAASKAQEEAMASFDIDGMRAKTQELKSALDEAMGGVLSAEQLAAWKEQTAGRGGSGGGRGGGGPGGGFGGGGGSRPPQN